MSGDIFLDADPALVCRLAVRLGVAALLGGIIGYEREKEHRAAGLRTHMLVALGSALFVIIPVAGNMGGDAVTRVIQGIAAGVGFLGAGAILKLSRSGQIRGLTTAAGVWLTAAMGAAVGAGWGWLSAIGVAYALFILYALHHLDRTIRKTK